MLVSVVIPAYNAENYIEHALRSASAQTHRELEVVVVDDGSTDRTAELVERFGDSRVVLVRRENAGEATARNTALEHTTGELIAFLDADDEWMPTKLETQLALMRSDKQIVGVGTLGYYLGRTFNRLGTTGMILGTDGSQDILTTGVMPFPISSLVVTRAACDVVGGFDPELTLAADYDFLLGLARVGPLVTVPERLTGYRLRGGALSTKYEEHHRAALYVAARRLHGDTRSFQEFQAQTFLSDRVRRRLRGQAAFREAGVAIADGRPATFVRSAGTAMLCSPRYSLRRLRGRLLGPKANGTTPK